MCCIIGDFAVFQFFLAFGILWMVNDVFRLPLHVSSTSLTGYKSRVLVPDSKPINRIDHLDSAIVPATVSINTQVVRNWTATELHQPQITDIVVTVNRTSGFEVTSGSDRTSGHATRTRVSKSSSNFSRAAVFVESGLRNGLMKKSKTRNDHRRRRRLPQAIIIGVKKGGTRALLEFLKIHPDVRARGPESHFFDKNFHKGFEWYRRQMPVTNGNQITVEKTPSYFVTRGVPERIRKMSPDVRLIIVVRDPVTRVVSDYAQAVTKRRDLHPFERLAFALSPVDVEGNATLSPVRGTTTTVDASWGPIRIGLYARYLERWLEHFPIDLMHFVSGENLVRNPAEEMEKLEKFLGLSPTIGKANFLMNTTKGFPCIRLCEGEVTKPRCLGDTKGRAHPKIEPETLQRLAQFFRPFNKKFYEMTGIDFGWM